MNDIDYNLWRDVASDIHRNNPLEISDSVMCDLFPEKGFAQPDFIISRKQKITKFCDRYGFEYYFNEITRSHWFKIR